MPAVRTGDTAPQMMVLGLVVQQPDTVAGIGRRLSDQFSAARFAKGSAHNNLPSLATKGYVCLVKPGPPGQPTYDFYEATPAGREHFLQWMRNMDVPVLVRDIMQCKLELAQPEDLPAIVRFVRALEESFADMCDMARTRVLREQRSRRAHPDRSPSWRQMMRSIQSRDEVMLWSSMSHRLECLGDELETMLAKAPPEKAR